MSKSPESFWKRIVGFFSPLPEEIPPQTGQEKPTERCFSVRRENDGIFVTDLGNGNKFFRTSAGGWFWLTGPGNPFDEDVTITGKETKKYLDQIVQTSQEPPLKPEK